MPLLLSISELPHGFVYPPQFVRVVELGLTELEPWHVLQGADLHDRLAGLGSRYPARALVPFAERQDNDDVACWDQRGDRVFVIHDYASPGWESRVEYEDFNGWLRQALEDFISFE